RAFIASNGDLRTSFQAAGYGAFSGALSGGISEHFGSAYGLDRVAAKAAAGGLRAAVMGGDIKKGFLQEFGWSALTYLNVQMRQAMIQNSLQDETRVDETGRKVNDGTGLSRGLF